jgi:hypothetical protein
MAVLGFHEEAREYFLRNARELRVHKECLGTNMDVATSLQLVPDVADSPYRQASLLLFELQRAINILGTPAAHLAKPRYLYMEGFVQGMLSSGCPQEAVHAAWVFDSVNGVVLDPSAATLASGNGPWAYPRCYIGIAVQHPESTRDAPSTTTFVHSSRVHVKREEADDVVDRVMRLVPPDGLVRSKRVPLS